MSFQLPIGPRTWGTRFDTLLDSPPISPPVQGVGFNSDPVDSVVSDSKLAPSKDEKTAHDASVFVGSLPCNVDQEELSRLLSDHLSEHSEIKSVKVVRDSKGGVCAFLQCEDPSSAASLICTLRSGPLRPFMGRILRYEPARAFRTLFISYRVPVQVFGTASISGRRQTVTLDLPYAMRLWKPKGSRYFNVVYNAEATDIEKRYGTALEHSPEGRFFMHPMAYDAEAVRLITSFFGPLEYFDRVRIDDGAAKDTYGASQLYPHPHNSPRSPCMDAGCWEVKWRHRDDCVRALMTLRRVPHLTVSWAHQPPQSISDQISLYYMKDSKQTQGATSALRDVSRSPPSHVYAPVHGDSSPANPDDDVNLGYSRSVHKKISLNYDLEQDTNLAGQGERVRIDWSDEDFQPMTDIQGPTKSEWGAWETEENSQLATGLGMTLYTGQDQTETLSTPGLATSPITPSSFGSTFPNTPTDLSGQLSGLALEPKISQDDPYANVKVLKGRSIDATTLFVGGLEMFGPSAWDENKVRRCFETYGVLESVKFFRPYNSCSAFAFVKYKTMDGPARAIKEEHNRIYEGRAIRVQLRECNGARNTWKPQRTRGRFFGPQQIPNRRLGVTNKTNDCQSLFQGQRNHMGASEDTFSYQKELEVHVDDLRIHNASSSTELVPQTALLSNPTTDPTSFSTASGWGKTEDDCIQTHDSNTRPTQTLHTSSVTVPVHPFTYPSFGYYPAPWFHPYLQYQFPYYPGYGGYMVSPPLIRDSSNANVSATATTQSAWHPTPNAYSTYVPYAMPPISQTQGSEATDSVADSQAPIIPPGFFPTGQSNSTVPHAEVHEQSANGIQGSTTPVAQPQLNVSVWPHYPFQPYHYPTPSSLNANAKAFLPPAPGWEPSPATTISDAQTNQTASHTAFPVNNSSFAHSQSTRRDLQNHTGNARLPRNQAFIGHNSRGTTNFNISRDNDHLELSKSTSNSANWI